MVTASLNGLLCLMSSKIRNHKHVRLFHLWQLPIHQVHNPSIS